MKVYLAGAMRGIEAFNFPAFFLKALELRKQGYEVFNPAERDVAAGFAPWALEGTEEELDSLGFSLREAITADLEYICYEADAIYMMAPWTESKGARLELMTALCLGLEVLGDVDTLDEHPFNLVKGPWVCNKTFADRLLDLCRSQRETYSNDAFLQHLQGQTFIAAAEFCKIPIFEAA